MFSAHLVLNVIALVCLFLAAINRPAVPVSLGWFGMFFWLLGTMIT